jgi:hypothetical protein
MRSALIAMLVLTSAGCATPAPVVCHPTVAHMTPPREPLEFMIGGSSTPDAARSLTPTMNWYGNDAMWVVLPPNGEIIGRLDDKIPPYRMKRGQITWSARQLDGNASVPTQAMTGYGDIGFQAGGPGFPNVGCWQVSYWLDGRDELQFVLRVR